MKNIFLLFLLFYCSISSSQIPFDSSVYQGEWQAIVADSSYTLKITLHPNNEVYAHFQKTIISSNQVVYDSDVNDGLYALYGGIHDFNSFKVIGIFTDRQVTGNDFQTAEFEFEITSLCTNCNNTGVLTLEELQGVKVPGSQPLRFPSGLTFVKQ